MIAQAYVTTQNHTQRMAFHDVCMTFIYAVFALLILSFFSATHAGDPQPAANMLSQAAKFADVQSCTVGRNPLGDDVEYSVQDIKGSLPYIRYYKSLLGEDAYGGVYKVHNPWSSIGNDWTDNYTGHILIRDVDKTRNRMTMRVKIPGVSQEYFYIVRSKLADVNTFDDVVRVYSKDPATLQTILTEGSATQKKATTDSYDPTGFVDTNHRDVSFKFLNYDNPKLFYQENNTTDANGFANAKMSIEIKINGVRYTYGNPNPDYATAIPRLQLLSITQPDGETTSIQYKYISAGSESNYKIDYVFNRSGKLQFTYTDGVATEIKYTPQNNLIASDTQTATYTYEKRSFLFREAGTITKSYLKTSASPLHPTENYTYQNLAMKWNRTQFGDENKLNDI